MRTLLPAIGFVVADNLAAIRYKDFKIHIKPAHGGLPGMDFFNIKRDPAESKPQQGE